MYETDEVEIWLLMFLFNSAMNLISVEAQLAI